jgi:uncharacterized protein YdaU (DUF1376 family)
MGQIHWYKRDPEAALEGMFELTLEERGAYNTVLDLIYARANNVPDDDRFIAGWLRCDVRVWKRIKGRLIEAGKLYVSDGLLCNERADAVVLECLSRHGSAEEAGRASGRKRRAQLKKNNDLARTAVATGASTSKSQSQNKKDSPTFYPSPDEPEPMPEQAPRPSRGPRHEKKSAGLRDSDLMKKTRPRTRGDGERLPPGWTPSGRNISDAVDIGLTPEQANDTADEFRDYWLARPGRAGMSADWDAAWRYWCRKAVKIHERTRSYANGGRASGFSGCMRDIFGDEWSDSAFSFEDGAAHQPAVEHGPGPHEPQHPAAHGEIIQLRAGRC